MNNLEKEYNNEIEELSKKGEIETNNISDGYHTFGELYKHIIHLFIALCKSLNKNYSIVKAKKHHDGSTFEGWFIIQIDHDYIGQISYHLPIEYWDKTDFIPFLEEAWEWDGHTSDDVLDRLLKI